MKRGIIAATLGTIVVSIIPIFSLIERVIGWAGLPDDVRTWHSFLINVLGMASAVERVFLVGLILCFAVAVGWKLKSAWSQIATSDNSPIEVFNQSFADYTITVDDNGTKIKDIIAVNFCLWVYNDLNNGKAIKNVRAHLYTLSSEAHLLPIRGSENGTTTIRHGERALVEIGYVLMPSNQPFLTPRISKPIKIDRNTEENNLKNGHRALNIVDLSGKLNTSFCQSEGSPAFDNITIIISADDFISRKVWLDIDLHKKWPQRFLTIKPTWSNPQTDEPPKSLFQHLLGLIRT